MRTEDGKGKHEKVVFEEYEPTAASGLRDCHGINDQFGPLDIFRAMADRHRNPFRPERPQRFTVNAVGA